MKRKDFFKTLFGVAAAAVVAPSVLAQEEEKCGFRWEEPMEDNTGLPMKVNGVWVEGADHMYDFGPAFSKEDLMRAKLIQRWEGYGMVDFLNELSVKKI